MVSSVKPCRVLEADIRILHRAGARICWFPEQAPCAASPDHRSAGGEFGPHARRTHVGSGVTPAAHALTSTTCSRPPKIMRLPSNGMGGLPSADGSIRGSLMIFFMPASRVALSGRPTHEKATVSSTVAWTARRKLVTLPSGTSSPQPSTGRRARPWAPGIHRRTTGNQIDMACPAGRHAPYGSAGAPPQQNVCQVSLRCALSVDPFTSQVTQEQFDHFPFNNAGSSPRLLVCRRVRQRTHRLESACWHRASLRSIVGFPQLDGSPSWNSMSTQCIASRRKRARSWAKRPPLRSRTSGLCGFACKWKAVCGSSHFLTLELTASFAVATSSVSRCPTSATVIKLHLVRS